jgi:hypothetical protein
MRRLRKRLQKLSFIHSSRSQLFLLVLLLIAFYFKLFFTPLSSHLSYFHMYNIIFFTYYLQKKINKIKNLWIGIYIYIYSYLPGASRERVSEREREKNTQRLESTAGRVVVYWGSLKENLKKILPVNDPPCVLNTYGEYMYFILKQIQQIAVICFLYIYIYISTFYAHVTFFFFYFTLRFALRAFILSRCSSRSHSLTLVYEMK